MAKPKGVYLEDCVTWKELPNYVQEFVKQTAKADKNSAKDFKDFPFGDDKALAKSPQMQITQPFYDFMGWYIHCATMKEKSMMWEMILYDTMARGSIKQNLVNDHDCQFRD